MAEWFSLLIKTTSQHLTKSKNTFEVEGRSLSKSTIKRHLHEYKYRGFMIYDKVQTTGYTQGNIWKSLLNSGIKGETEPRWICIRKVWKRGETARDPKHTTSSVRHGGGIVMAWACMATSGTRPLVIEAAGWNVKCTELYSLLRFGWMLQNWSDRASQCKWIMNQRKWQK